MSRIDWKREVEILEKARDKARSQMAIHSAALEKARAREDHFDTRLRISQHKAGLHTPPNGEPWNSCPLCTPHRWTGQGRGR